MTRIPRVTVRQRPDGVYYLDYTVGRRRYRPAVGTNARAAATERVAVMRALADGTWKPPVDGRSAIGATVGGLTVRAFAETWLERRDGWTHDGDGKVLTAGDDRVRFERHILPILGDMALTAVAGGDIVRWLEGMRTKKKENGKPISKGTIVNCYANVVTLFADAEQDGLIERSPCDKVRKQQRPPRARRAETQGVALSAVQLSRLIFARSIPPDRRVLWALQALTGTRFSEAVALRWSDYDSTVEPLGRIRIERQWDAQREVYRGLKGKRGEPGPPREAPVHPALAAILSAWRHEGFPMLFCRAPAPDDLIVPSRTGPPRSLRHMARKLQADCKRVGITIGQATHVLRRAFKTIAVAHGAPEVWIERIIHNASGGVEAAYLGDVWEAKCEAVARMPISNVVETALAIARDDEDRDDDPTEDDPRGGGDRRLANRLANTPSGVQLPSIFSGTWRGGRDSKAHVRSEPTMRRHPVSRLCSR